MRKIAIGLSLFSLIAGVFGFFIRKRELETVFDPGTGLAQSYAPISLALIALSAVVGLVLIAVLLSIGKVQAGDSYTKAFGSRGPFPFFISFLICIVMLAGSAMYLYDMFRTASIPVPELVFVVLAVFSAFSILTLSHSVYKGKSGSEVPLCSIVPIAFLCFWLILAYRSRAADPVILDYVYEMLALVLSILGFFYSAGFAYRRLKPRRLIFFSNAAVYMCIVTLADEHFLPVSVFFACIAAVLLINSVLVSKNLRK